MKNLYPQFKGIAGCPHVRMFSTDPEFRTFKKEFCNTCGQPNKIHGFIGQSIDDGLIVCPGAYIVPIKDKEFQYAPAWDKAWGIGKV